MERESPKILIGYDSMAAHLGVSARELFRHRFEMRAAGVVEEHLQQGRLYSVALPERINRYWRERSFE